MDYERHSKRELIAEIERLKRQLDDAQTPLCCHGEDSVVKPFCFRSFVDCCDEAVFQLTADGTYVYINRAGAAQLGVEPAEMVGKRVDDFFDAETASWMRAEIREALAGDGPTEAEYPVPLSSGLGHHFVSLRPLKNEEGKAAAVVGRARDVSLWRQRWMDAAAEARLYRTLAASIPGAGSFVFDRELRYVLAEGSELAAVGLRKEDLEGKRVPEVVTAKTWDRIEPFLRGALEGESAFFELPHEGQTYEVHIAPLKDSAGSISGGLIFVQNITKRKKAEIHLARHDGILEAVRFAGQAFLAPGDFDSALQEVLNRLGEAAEVSRAYLFQNETNEEGLLCMTQRAEWAAPDISPEIGNPYLRQLPYEKHGLDRLRRRLSHRQHVSGLVRDFSDADRAILEPQGILSIAVVPVFCGEEWWGFIGFDDCSAERKWSTPELDALHTAATLVGRAIERREHEKVLQEARDRLAHMFDTTLVALAVSRADDGRYIEANEGFCELTGYSREEIIGRTSRELGFLTDGQRRTLSERLKESGRLHDQELTFYTKQGRLRTALFSISSLQSGGEACCLAVMVDITERKRAEEALVRERAFIRTIIDTDPNTIFVKDAKGNFVLVNQACADLFETSVYELTGRSNIEVLTDQTEDAGYSAIDRQVIKTGETYTLEELHARKDGGHTWFLTTKAPITLPDGRPGVLGVCADLTERKAAELELQRREADLRRAQQVARIGSWVFDVATDTSYWSDMLYEITGIERGDEGISWEALWDAIHPDDARDYEATARRCIEQGEGYRTEVRILRPNGETVYLDVRGEPELDGEGRVVRVSGTAQDVSELRKAYDQLSESEYRFRMLVENVGEGIAVVDENEEFAFANPAAAIIFGVDTDLLVGESLSTFMEPAEFERIRAETSRRKSGEDSVYELRIRRPDGEFRDLLLTAVPQFNARGAFAGTFGVFRDISERKHAEDALRQSERFTASLLNATPTPIFYKDRDGRYLGCNHAFEAIMGVSAGEICGKTVYDLWPSGLAKKYHEQDLALMASPEHQVYEFEVKDKDGVLRPVLFAKDVFCNAGGEVAGLVGAFLDISELKRTEQALRESEERYRAVVSTAPTGIILQESSGRIVTVNEAAEKLLGFTAAEIDGQTSGERDWHTFREDGSFLPGDEHPSMITLATGKPCKDVVVRIDQESGASVWVSANTNPIFGNGSDKPTAVVVVLSDITALKEAEKSLRESEERYRAIVSALPDILFRIDSECRFADCQVQDESVLLAPPKSFVGKRASECLPRYLAELTEAKLGATLSSGEMQVYGYNLDWEGENRWYEARMVPCADAGVLVIVRNVTEQKRAEEALLESQERYRTLFENAPVATFEEDFSSVAEWIEEVRNRGVADFEGYIESHPEEVEAAVHRVRIVSLNEATVRMFEADSKEHVLGPLSKNFPVESYPFFRRELEAIWAGQTSFEIEFSGRTFQGRPIDYLLRWSVPLIDGQPNLSRVIVAVLDITQRKRAEEALRISEELFAKSFRNAPLMMTLSSIKDGRYIEVNDAFVASTGYTREAAIGTSSVDLGFIAPEERKRLGEELRKEGRVYGLELTLRRADGSRMHALYSGELIRMGDEDRLLSVAIDISERRKAQAALQESEKEKSLILNATQELFAYYSLDLEIQWVNQAAAASVGKTPEELVGRHCFEVWQHRADICPDCVLLKVRESGRAEEGEMETPDGRHWYLRGYPIHDEAGNLAALVELGRDITDQKRAENALRASERDLRQAQQIAKVGSWRRDLATGVMTWSDAMFSVFGLEPACEAPPYETLRGLVHPEDLPFFEEAWTECTQQAGAHSVELRIIRPDGAVRVIYCRQETEYDAQSVPVALAGTVQDITERKEAERALQRYAEAQELLLREVNHRVKNNLMALRGMLSAARRREELAQHCIAADVLDDLDHRVTTLLVVHQMLSSAGWRPIELGSLLREICGAVVRGSASGQGLEVHVEADPVLIGPDQAHQLALALNELSTNTLKHGEPKGADRIDVAARQCGHKIEIEYRDNGPGFAPEVLEGAERRGVGLSLLHHVVEGNLGGTVTLRNEGGACVHLQLRMADERPEHRSETT